MNITEEEVDVAGPRIMGPVEIDLAGAQGGGEPGNTSEGKLVKDCRETEWE